MLREHHWLNVYEFEWTLWTTGKPGVLQSIGSQRVVHDLATEQQHCHYSASYTTWIIIITSQSHSYIQAVSPFDLSPVFGLIFKVQVGSYWCFPYCPLIKILILSVIYKAHEGPGSYFSNLISLLPLHALIYHIESCTLLLSHWTFCG